MTFWRHLTCEDLANHYVSRVILHKEKSLFDFANNNLGNVKWAFV